MTDDSLSKNTTETSSDDQPADEELPFEATIESSYGSVGMGALDGDLPTVNIEESRRISGSDYSPTGRIIVDEPLEPDTNPISARALNRAADLVDESVEGAYRPTIVSLVSNDDEKPEDEYPTLALVNEDNHDDVIVITPLVRYESDDGGEI